MRAMRNVRARVAMVAGLVVAGVAGLCPSADAAYYVSNEAAGNLDVGFAEFNHVQMRLDLPGATFSWIWHPGGNMVHRDSAGTDVGSAAWTSTIFNGLGADGNAYVIRDFFPDGEPQANDYSWGGPMTLAITSETIDVANTLFTINFNLYATDGSTSTGGAGTQSLRKSFDLIHYANNTWNQGTADDWYGNTRAIGPTGEDPGWNVVGGGTWNPGYLTAAPVPEPTSLAVLAVGSMLALRRRDV